MWRWQCANVAQRCWQKERAMNSARDFSKIEVEASEWLVTMSDRRVSLEDRARFEAWLAMDAEHAKVYEVQKSAWSAIASMPHLLEETYKKRSGRRFVPAAIAASLLVVAL